MILNEEKLRDRIRTLYNTMATRSKPKLFKRGKNAGKVRKNGLKKLPFDRHELFDHVLKQIGVGSARCQYCVAIGRPANVIDMLNCVLDHKEPVATSKLAAWDLENVFAICADCNNLKGGFTYDFFIELMVEIENMDPTRHDRMLLIKCLRTHGVAQRFQRDGKDNKTEGSGIVILPKQRGLALVAADEDF